MAPERKHPSAKQPPAAAELSQDELAQAQGGFFGPPEHPRHLPPVFRLSLEDRLRLMRRLADRGPR